VPLECLQEGKLPVVVSRQQLQHSAHASPSLGQAQQSGHEQLGAMAIAQGFRTVDAVSAGPAQLLERKGLALTQRLMGRLEGIGTPRLDDGRRESHAAGPFLRRRQQDGQFAGTQELFRKPLDQPQGRLGCALGCAPVGILQQEHLNHRPQVAGFSDQQGQFHPVLPAVPEPLRKDDNGVVRTSARLQRNRNFTLPGAANLELAPQFLLQTFAGNRHQGRLELDIRRVGLEI